ncbi:hypothetical protein MCUN1_001736 [Malassezia cuniculi]|uniref:ABM domain-containing protein n=1 Tax=Malassezia cuniculi TaxID=948313 RepID=A0AAF0EUK8_9BASI|nr:hypothetical protein MCUN1_001736 [Malassezia cuniculi]
MSAPPAQGPFILVATIIAKDKAQADSVSEKLKTIAKLANSDTEPGTLTYRVTRSADEEGLTFIIFEEYESNDAFEAHKSSAEFQSLLPIAAELKTFEFKFLTQVYP